MTSLTRYYDLVMSLSRYYDLPIFVSSRTFSGDLSLSGSPENILEETKIGKS